MKIILEDKIKHLQLKSLIKRKIQIIKILECKI